MRIYRYTIMIHSVSQSFSHSFIRWIYIAPLHGYYSEALQTLARLKRGSWLPIDIFCRYWWWRWIRWRWCSLSVWAKLCSWRPLATLSSMKTIDMRIRCRPSSGAITGGIRRRSLCLASKCCQILKVVVDELYFNANVLFKLDNTFKPCLEVKRGLGITSLTTKS